MVNHPLLYYDLVLYYIDFLVLIHFMDLAYGKYRSSVINKHILILIMAVCSGLFLWNTPFGGTYPFFSVIISFAFLPFYEKSRQKKLLFSCIQLALSGFSVMLAIAVIRIFQIQFLEIDVKYFLLFGEMHITLWLMILLLSVFRQKQKILLPKKLFGIVLTIPVSSLFVLICFAIRIDQNLSTSFVLEIPVIVTFIFINFMTAFIYQQFCNAIGTNHERILLAQQLVLAEQHYQELSGMQDRIKSIHHDMKNHLDAIALMADEAPTDNIKQYISALNQEIADTSYVVSTGNFALDALLSAKISNILEKRIPLEKKIILPSGINLTYEDSIIILGNVLDNAIEACGKIPEEMRWIKLEIQYMEHSLLIRLANPICVKANLTEGLPVTTKDNDIHGFGLKNVQEAISKYHGVFDISQSDNVFLVKILLYGI